MFGIGLGPWGERCPFVFEFWRHLVLNLFPLAHSSQINSEGLPIRDGAANMTLPLITHHFVLVQLTNPANTLVLLYTKKIWEMRLLVLPVCISMTNGGKISPFPNEKI
jgi:hypothetical protein